MAAAAAAAAAARAAAENAPLARRPEAESGKAVSATGGAEERQRCGPYPQAGSAAAAQGHGRGGGGGTEAETERPLTSGRDSGELKPLPDTSPTGLKQQHSLDKPDARSATAHTGKHEHPVTPIMRRWPQVRMHTFTQICTQIYTHTHIRLHTCAYAAPPTTPKPTHR